jgi:magnesium transporter
MMRVFVTKDGCLRQAELPPAGIPSDFNWLDLLNPTTDEIKTVESALRISLPTREEMHEIEASSRVYLEDGAQFMTATIVSRAETENPEAHAITFILVGTRLVTMRYSEPLPFTTYPQRAERQPGLWQSGEMVLAGLMETIIDRTADILERVSFEVDAISKEVFDQRQSKEPLDSGDFQEVLVKLGRKNDLAGKVRESLISISRVITFLNAVDAKPSKDMKGHLKTMSRDVLSLSDHTSYLSNKITFLLEATLGMISIEQNRVIKILAVGGTLFLPPTVIASIWGMNFQHMPELDEVWGYPLALTLIAISALLPFLYFKWRNWL